MTRIRAKCEAAGNKVVPFGVVIAMGARAALATDRRRYGPNQSRYFVVSISGFLSSCDKVSQFGNCAVERSNW